jgi:hypothetical protein
MMGLKPTTYALRMNYSNYLRHSLRDLSYHSNQSQVTSKAGLIKMSAKNNAVFTVGSVNVYEVQNKRKNTYRIRWYNAEKKQQSLSVKAIAIAQHTALKIAQDIALNIYHPRDYYDPKKSLEKQAIDHKYSKLDYLWNEWEKLDHGYSESSLLTHRRIKQVFTLVTDKALSLDNAHDFLTEYRKMYSDGTIYRDMAVIVACVNYWVRIGKVKFNPYPAIKSQLRVNKGINKDDNKGRFTEDEQRRIINSFCIKGNDNSTGNPSHYLRLIQFLFLTGLRPSEVVPLTWGDIDWNKGIISINKTMVKGHIRNNTKQGKKDKIIHRKYVMNNEQKDFLRGICSNVDT